LCKSPAASSNSSVRTLTYPTYMKTCITLGIH
jgi:hypothetical protein